MADRISDLPYSLLCHIISFLPTKLAVSTSVLSKRWTPLWLSVLTLDFDDESFIDFGSFLQFANSVIDSREATLPLRSFRIRCKNLNNFYAHDFNRFIQAVVQRRPENFDLVLSDPEFCYQLPELALEFLSCKTLVVLKLKYFAVGDIPYLVDLPLLKTLYLAFIIFRSDFVHFGNLLRGCPILEDFHTDFLILPYSNRWHDSAREFKGFPNLVRANFCYSVLEENFPFTWFHNVKFLRVQLLSPYAYEIPTFHNLTHMELIFDSRSWTGKWKWVTQVLQHCPKLQNLLIIVKAFTCARLTENEDWKDPKIVPECLSSQLRTCSLQGFRGNQWELQFFEYIMLNSKLLCTMTIKSSYWVDENAKHQMLVKLASYPKGSVTCKFLFD